MQSAQERDSKSIFEDECVALFAQIVQLFGVPKSVGQIYGLLYASPAPLGFMDILARLEISKGSASQGLRLLRSLGAINEALVNVGERRGGTVFEPELSLRQLVSGVLREQIAPMGLTATEQLKRLRQLADGDSVHGKFYLSRVKQLEMWRQRVNTVLPVLTALLGPKKRGR
jgi:DNA-binding transcriptional regulator GbsR (MarR family)